MTSCPSERELIELVDLGLPARRETVVLDHLTQCADCRGLLSRAEASLRLALGGLADAGSTAPPRGGARRVHRRRAAAFGALAAVAVAAAVLFGGASPDANAPATAETALLARLTELRERARRCAEAPRPMPEDDVAAIAEAAAEARTALGLGDLR